VGFRLGFKFVFNEYEQGRTQGGKEGKEVVWIVYNQGTDFNVLKNKKNVRKKYDLDLMP
jgi:hypothetical protein